MIRLLSTIAVVFGLVYKTCQIWCLQFSARDHNFKTYQVPNIITIKSIVLIKDIIKPIYIFSYYKSTILIIKNVFIL